MPLQQFTAEWITPEDRIRVRIHAGDGQEYRFWLTRHFLAAFMGGARGLAVQVLAQQHPPEIAQAMDEFRQQSVGQQADFTRSFEPQAQLPLGEDALLLTGLTITQTGEHVSLTLGTATGLDITLSITAFWTLAGNIFDIRQSKRVFGLMNGGSWLAYVVVGFFITPLVNAFGAENLYTFIILCLVIGLAFLLAILRANPHTTQPHPVALHNQPISVRSLLRKRYIVLIFGLMAI